MCPKLAIICVNFFDQCPYFIQLSFWTVVTVPPASIQKPCLFRNYTESEALLKISCQEASKFQSSWCHISLISITTRERIVQKHPRTHSISITVSVSQYHYKIIRSIYWHRPCVRFMLSMSLSSAANYSSTLSPHTLMAVISSPAAIFNPSTFRFDLSTDSQV